LSSTERMKAVVCYAPRKYLLEERPLPRAGAGEVIVRVGASGICGSDIKCYEGAEILWGGPRPYVKPPVIPGHEFVGEVVELGPGASERTGLKVGDKSVAEQIVPCWECRYCRTGKYWMCQVHDIFGFQGGIDDGGFAEYMKYPARAIVHKVPKGIPDERAAFIEPLSCAIHAVQRAKIELGEFVVIAGMGPLGLCMLQLAKLKNPAELVALDIKDNRLRLAQRLGATLTLNVAREDAVRRVLEMTQEYGCDVYIEASASTSGVTQGLQMIRKLGRFVEFSVHGQPTTADWSVIGDRKELDVLGSHLGPYCYPLAIDYIERGIVDVDPIVTHAFPLHRFEEAFEVAHRAEDAIKVMLKP
jgi:threonine dehydrogenase-like Zn-dependent dehydrogenase